MDLVPGSDYELQAGNYGTMGTAASSNIPGARYSAVSWLDSFGKFWFFGGGGLDSTISTGYLNDSWKYDPATLDWAWMSGSDIRGQKGTYGTQGTTASSNIPGARQGSVSWLDSNGKLWLFGGYGYDSAGNTGVLNDLWKNTR